MASEGRNYLSYLFGRRRILQAVEVIDRKRSSGCCQQPSFSGLQSHGWSFSIKVCYFSVQTILLVEVMFHVWPCSPDWRRGSWEWSCLVKILEFVFVGINMFWARLTLVLARAASRESKWALRRTQNLFYAQEHKHYYCQFGGHW